ncbi:hypothetical protein BX600DRAFT_513977 [Xylariales sp. PMI_506]|nr:hypothetical protein BX600DRAFT_513977 [Xylariales sp. PMI_506]
MWKGTPDEKQKLKTIAAFALQLSKAESVVPEVAHCLQLMRLISRDALYLNNLKEEYLPALQGSPQKLGRIGEVLESASQSVDEVYELLRKYRHQANTNGSSVSLPIVWLTSDLDAFAVGSKGLQTEHQTILNEISYLRNYRHTKTVPQGIPPAQRYFENVELLRSLMGHGPSHSATQSIEVPQKPSEDADQAPNNMQDIPKPVSKRATESMNDGDAKQNPDSVLGMIPELPANDETWSNLGGKWSSREDINRQYPPMSSSPSQTMVGLLALFQQPAPVPSQSKSPILITATRINSPSIASDSGSATGSSPPVLPAITSTSSLESLCSFKSDPSSLRTAPALNHESSVTPQTNSERLRTKSFGPGPCLSTATVARTAHPETVTVARHRGLSQLFIYRPQSSSISKRVGRMTHHELEGSSTASLDSTVVKVSVSTGHTSSDSSENRDEFQIPTVSDEPTADGTGRHRVDSAAWQRRTELLQMSSVTSR